MKNNFLKTLLISMIFILLIFPTETASLTTNPSNPFVDISAGDVHALAVKADGSVWRWGMIESRMHKITVPTKVEGIENVIKTSCGETHSIALKKDGTVWGWGLNYLGQLGIDPDVLGQTDTPIHIDVLTNIVDISTTRYKTYVLKGDGTVWYFGSDNSSKEDGQYLLKQIDGMNNIERIYSRSEGLYAVDSSGTVFYKFDEGMNSTESPDPSKIAKKIVNGYIYDMVLLVSGELIIMENGHHTNNFTGLERIDNVVDMDTRNHHGGYVKKDGTVWTFGRNTYGQIGDGTFVDKYYSVQVKGIENAQKIATSYYSTIVLCNDGSIKCFGSNDYGLIGNGKKSEVAFPVKIDGLSDISQVYACGNRSCALDNNSNAFFWGSTSAYFDKEGLSSQVSLPKALEEVNDIKKISVGDSHIMLLTNMGEVYSFGSNSFGQLGNGTFASNDMTSPIKITGLSDVKDIACGGQHSVILKNDGTVWIAGRNCNNQLLHNNLDESSYFLKAPGLDNVIKIAASDFTTVAQKSDGQLWIWGRDTYSDTIYKVDGIYNIKEISFSFERVLLLTNDGTVWKEKRSGDSEEVIFEKVEELNNIVDMTCMSYYTNVFLRNDGTITFYGIDLPFNDPLQKLEKNDSLYISYPFISDVVDIASGSEHVLALKNDGTVWSFGSNEYGQLGIEDNGSEPLPVDVRQFYITMAVNSPQMIFNGQVKDIYPGEETTPVIVNSRTLIPIRSLIENIGGEVGWNGDEKKVTIYHNEKSIELWINSNTSVVNGVQMEMDVAPLIINSRTMLPLRFIIENLGFNVDWDGLYKRITITD
mgnify:CR=1 FL=1